eukprot:gnl/TRDRNA2_/TRDRNA2_92694_c2_seq1.p3 gnl/TRDRNA2_/TRDRNA2_92694_c2~~gnl/TRDRNA2_/TRDRNA2_92694_c2_seq1.p3  ORF type:complete len:137 (-),score=17.33 gnl/TRDRNA2_/TRDRNA2_92694_c2_seq1:29-439(-)
MHFQCSQRRMPPPMGYLAIDRITIAICRDDIFQPSRGVETSLASSASTPWPSTASSAATPVAATWLTMAFKKHGDIHAGAMWIPCLERPKHQLLEHTRIHFDSVTQLDIFSPQLRCLRSESEQIDRIDTAHHATSR